MEATVQQLVDQMTGMTSQIQDLLNEVNRLNDANTVLVNRMNQERAAFEARLDELRKVLDRRPGQSSGLIDTRQIGKPSVYKSDRAEWPTFSFKLINFLVSMYPSMRQACIWAASCSKAITNLHDLSDSLVEETDETLDSMDRDLYSALASLVEGEGLDIIKNVKG